jgi:hypothetical protein
MSLLVKRIVLIVASVVLCQPMRARQTNAPTIIIHVNLAKFGWLPYPMQRGEYEFSGQPLVIDRENRVWAGFTVHNVRQGLSTRQNPGLSFHMLRFDKQGELDLSLAIPTDGLHNHGVYLAAADDILAQANDRIEVLTASDEAHADESSWKILAPCGRSCLVKQSVSRRTLVLQDLASASEAYVLQGSPPRRLEHCPTTSDSGIFNSLTDNFAYFYHNLGNPPMPPPVFYRRPFCDFSQRSELPFSVRAGEVRAVNDNSFLVGYGGKIAIYDADGNVRREVRMGLGKHEGGGRGQVSENGNRVAIIAGTSKGGFRPLDISPHMVAERVIVYDLASGTQLVSIPVSPMRFFLPLAMSPDGHRVAFLDDGILTIVDMP